MAITGAKYEAYHSIKENSSLYIKKDQKLSDETIIRVALSEYDVNITKEDLERMKKEYTRYMMKYKMLL